MASRASIFQLSRAASRFTFTSSTSSSITRSASTLLRSTSNPNHTPARLLRSQPFSTSLPRLSDSPEAVEPPDYLSEGERKVFGLIKEGLSPTKLEVQDISGGCGSMYGIDIVSEKFAGLSVIKQHRLVNQVLGEEIKKWHGVQLKTKAP